MDGILTVATNPIKAEVTLRFSGESNSHDENIKAIKNLISELYANVDFKIIGWQ